jgi:hypothetical protein
MKKKAVNKTISESGYFLEQQNVVSEPNIKLSLPSQLCISQEEINVHSIKSINTHYEK